jgi:hypothetical protein
MMDFDFESRSGGAMSATDFDVGHVDAAGSGTAGLRAALCRTGIVMSFSCFA